MAGRARRRLTERGVSHGRLQWTPGADRHGHCRRRPAAGGTSHRPAPAGRGAGDDPGHRRRPPGAGSGDRFRIIAMDGREARPGSAVLHGGIGTGPRPGPRPAAPAGVQWMVAVLGSGLGRGPGLARGRLGPSAAVCDGHSGHDGLGDVAADPARYRRSGYPLRHPSACRRGDRRVRSHRPGLPAVRQRLHRKGANRPDAGLRGNQSPCWWRWAC